MSKGVSQVATMAIYVGATVTAISGAVTVGAPVLENLQDANSIQEAQNLMEAVDSNADQVLSEGEGSTRTIQGGFDRGEVYFSDRTDSLIYELNTDAEVISPQSSLRDGNIVLSSSANVEVYPAEKDGDSFVETDEENADCYLMENDVIKTCIKNVGSQEDPNQDIDTSELVQYYEFKEQETSFDGEIKVMLDEEEETSIGTGFTEAADTGEFQGTGEVKATVSSDFGYRYDIFYRLPTGSDFLRVDVQNFR